MFCGKSRKIEIGVFFDSRRHQSLVLDKRPHNQPVRGSIRLYLPTPAAHMSWLAGYRNSACWPDFWPSLGVRRAQVWLNFGMFQSAVNDRLQKIVSYVTLCTKNIFSFRRFQWIRQYHRNTFPAVTLHRKCQCP